MGTTWVQQITVWITILLLDSTQKQSLIRSIGGILHTYILMRLQGQNPEGV